MEFTKDDYVVEGNLDVVFVMYDLTKVPYKNTMRVVVKPSWIIIEQQSNTTAMNRDKIVCFSIKEV